MLAKLRCVKKTYLRKGFYSWGEAWPVDQGGGWAANTFLHFGRALDRSKWRCGGAWWYVILSYIVGQRYRRVGISYTNMFGHGQSLPWLVYSFSIIKNFSPTFLHTHLQKSCISTNQTWLAGQGWGRPATSSSIVLVFLVFIVHGWR
jgi:hypothetical protein